MDTLLISRRLRGLGCTLGVAFVLGAGSAVAQEVPRQPEDLQTARGLGMGTGARASAIGNTALALNPAAMPTGRLYHIEGLAGYHSDGRWSLGSAVIDSVTNQLAAGLAFRGILGSDGEYDGIDGRLALGLPLADSISIGVAGRYLSLQPEGQNVPGDPRVKGFTMDASIQLNLAEGLNIAALGYNLIDMESSLAPQILGGSASFALGEVLVLGGDVLVDLNTFDKAKLIAGGGAEYLVGGAVPIRAGYRFDQGRRIHSITGSIGYIQQSVGIGLGVRHDVSGADGTEGILSLRYHVR